MKTRVKKGETIALERPGCTEEDDAILIGEVIRVQDDRFEVKFVAKKPRGKDPLPITNKKDWLSYYDRFIVIEPEILDIFYLRILRGS